MKLPSTARYSSVSAVTLSEVEAILEVRADKYLDKYAMVIFTTAAEVFRQGRFSLANMG
ncbi:MAG: hypothetical protein ACOY5B_14740 [Spirochaetota bacterium]